MHYLNFPSWLKPQIIPGLPFRWYALMYVVAFAVVFMLFMRQLSAQERTAGKEKVTGFFITVFLSGLLGARLFYALVYEPTGIYLHKPWLLFWPFDSSLHFRGIAGMSYHGCMIGGTIGALVYARIKRIDILHWGDMLLAAFPLGYTFGRIGNFINAELYGRVTLSPWGVLFPDAERLPSGESWVRDVMHHAGIDGTGMVNLPRHPSQLYEAFGEGLLLWLILWFIVRKRQRVKGAVIAAYFIGYGAIRFIIEYFRTPDRGLDFPVMLTPVNTTSHLVISPLNLTTGQLLCAAMIAGGLVFYLALRRNERRGKELQEPV